MALEIIGAGFGRTGTASLKLALEQLGFGPCHHMFEVNDDAPKQIDYWEAAANGEAMDWDQVFADFRSQLDWPGCRYWRELATHYPDAKVILSVREVEGWIKSYKATIAPYFEKRGQFDDQMRNRKSELVYKIIAGQTFNDRYNEDDHLREVFLSHIKEVQNTIAPERLLTFDVREGWEPLCEFLGVSVPDGAFPSTNSTKDFQERTHTEDQ